MFDYLKAVNFKCGKPIKTNQHTFYYYSMVCYLDQNFTLRIAT